MSEQLMALTQAFKQQDTDKISIIAHTIKGTASNIGAKRLAAFAAQLEQNIKHNVQIDADVYLVQLQGQINDSLHVLETLFPDETAVLTANELDKVPLLPITSIGPDKIDRLMALLVEQNLDAIGYLEQLSDNMATDKNWSRLKSQVSQLEFLDAIDTLKSIIKE